MNIAIVTGASSGLGKVFFEKVIERYPQLDGSLVVSFNLFVKQQTSRIMMNCPHKQQHTIPHQLLAEHYSNTLQLIIEWCFLRKKITSKEEAEKCLRYLLENVK